ncbi:MULTISPECIES: nucleotidyl transferase AbiEii/AbiGii toxin family protein [unclassified Marinobacterium]|jgi:predicted nucleotidyltransferase component of viral defense system|uniref:nucleotidyl transferase AbiEii/AbiGii toxin family protein n=1 Tax=unclassified Marinobacterium TaxID=2644139 RepID=UPI00156A4DD1|nr:MULTISPECIES: nucleotidyl transferase AbiEii/AbiGii toxin family protein [unclassified Marinobacterium]NRP14373.1 hypothetical protein [Marinobacterium sp. xm-a-152]NRP27495.1 hypothetical protein [Marinobacterium sp. xm-d-420]NRP36143.1 hypothetical protein [Marinobacterium sp. xm-d-579]NRP47207.1 hypothetical protein [Marinobacterium sp. xm-d-543]NRP57753.1 hypothetical protein [Marinobacterium sp. xm-d-510]
MNNGYKRQVKLLLDVLPEVARESSFALHGGTAINLFIRDMPRLSVDIDLTYIGFDDRNTALQGINAGLERIKTRIEGLRSSIKVQHRSDVCKLLVDDQGVKIKLEVNTIGRGLLHEANRMPLCDRAQEEFDVFCAIPVVPLSQLYGGKICAALDRQHPRDLFDVRLLSDEEGIGDNVKLGIIYGLLCSNRPTHEMLNPRLSDQRAAYENQFRGMSDVTFSYTDFEETRALLIARVKSLLNDVDREFLLGVNRLEPDWSHYNFQVFPAIKWKLLNLQNFKNQKPDVYRAHLSALDDYLKR